MRKAPLNFPALAGRGAALLLLAMSVFVPAPDRAPERAALAVIVDGDGDAAAVRARVARELDDREGRLHVAVTEASLPERARVEQTLEQALWQLERGARNAVLIASDGHWPTDLLPLLHRAADAGVALYWLPLEHAEAPPRILSIAAPARAHAGEAIAIVIATDPLPAGYELALYGNGDRLARAPAHPAGRTILRVRVPVANALRLGVELLGASGAGRIDELAGGAIVNVAGTPRLLLLADRPSPLGDALVAGGWSLDHVSTQAFPARVDSLAGYSALIVDDVTATALPDASWRAVAAAVRREGLGLLVLGGPHSFGLGAYRGSVLEELLPVVSEPPDREQPAAVLFLVDVSGSMGRQANERLRIAGAAVQFTAASLRPADRVGLTVFDVEARALLPLAPRADHAAALRRVWPEHGSGGTRIADALASSLEALSGDDARQKLLVLVTDGMLAAEDVALFESKLAGGAVELIALLLEDHASTPLVSALAGGGHATVLRVDDVMRLPGLMRGQVEAQRPALAYGPDQVAAASAPPFLDAAVDWPEVDAWLVTRPRREARVMLAAARSGDPLLAAGTAGAGRVVALPGGLGSWSAGWIEWERWPRLAAGLAGYVALRDPGAVRIEPARDGEPAWILDTGGAPAPERVLASVDGGEPVALRPEPVAPGRWRVALPDTPRAGAVTLSWSNERGAFRYTLAAAAPRRPAPVGRPSAADAVEAGLVSLWSEAAVERLSPPGSWKAVTTALALLVFLATLALEAFKSNRTRRPGFGNA